MATKSQAADILSAFDFKRNVAASSSSEQTSVSPGTSVKATVAQPAARMRRPPYISFSSSEGPSAHRIWIPSDRKRLEEVDSRHNWTISEDYEPSLSPDKGTSHLVEASAAAMRGLKKDIPDSRKLSSLRSLQSPPEPISSASTVAPKERSKWTRSQSGSIWIHKHRNVRETSSSDYSAGLTGITVMPLVPPTPPSRPKMPASKTSSVRIETPFPDAQQPTEPARKVSKMSTAESLPKRVSLATQKVLSAPIVALRRFFKTKPTASNVQANPDQDAPNSPIEPQSHKSNLRRQQTAKTLNRVSSLLLEVSRVPKIKSNFGRSALDKARSLQEGHNGSRTATFDISKNKSVGDTETTVTATSSILKMQMGSTPLNSIFDTATYKVKRSPSQETEEFLAIDISIRGGTSYLPSEARRIHTPPLPDDDVINQIHKQTYVFDYYPSNSTKASGSPNQQPNSQTFVPARGISQSNIDKPNPFTSTTSLALQNPSTVRDLSLSPTKPYDSLSEAAGTVKEKSDDWLETPQNTGLNAHINDVEDPKSKHDRTRTLSAHEQHQQFLYQLDWTIPEHLPSSPLCPRHPRY